MRERERTQINKIKNEREDVTTDTTEIQNIVRKYFKQQTVCQNLDILGNTDKAQETCNLSKLNQEESGNLNRPITTNDIKE